jgi:dCTP deaminase
MRLLTKPDILELLKRDDADSLFIDPLLREDQVGAVSVDLRLGYDFLVSVLTRRPAIETYPVDRPKKRGIHSYFQETRRRLGERFVLYPHQVVLSTTVEYVSLPVNVLAEIAVRSSYGRLGIGITTVMQPGWRGAIPLEIFNHGNTPVDMVLGSCVCQARLYEVENNVGYVGGVVPRKYFATVRPTVSKAERDTDLSLLSKIGQ